MCYCKTLINLSIGAGGRRRRNCLGEAPRSARRCGDREQKVVDLNSNCLCGMNETKEKTLEERLTLAFFEQSHPPPNKDIARRVRKPRNGEMPTQHQP